MNNRPLPASLPPMYVEPDPAIREWLASKVRREFQECHGRVPTEPEIALSITSRRMLYEATPTTEVEWPFAAVHEVPV